MAKPSVQKDTGVVQTINYPHHCACVVYRQQCERHQCECDFGAIGCECQPCECDFGAIGHNYEIMRSRSFCIQDGVWFLQLEKKEEGKDDENDHLSLSLSLSC